MHFGKNIAFCMKTKFCIKKFIILLLICISLDKANAEYVIVNNNVNIDSLSTNVIRSIFLMRIKEWADHNQIEVFVLETGNKLHIDFCNNALGLFPYQLQRAWDRQVFSGIGQYPTVLKTQQELIEKVATTPGAIGYASELPNVPSVKVVEVHDEKP